MSSMAQTLARRAAAQKADPSTPPMTTEEMIQQVQELEEAKAASTKMHEAPSGSFIAHRLPMIVLKSGQAVKPTNGYYMPKSQEELEMLEYYNNLNLGLVTFVE